MAREKLVPVRLHRWVEGRGPGPGPVDVDVAAWAGRTLARLHGLGVRAADRDLFPFPDTRTADDWPELVAAAYRSTARWADQLKAATADVAAIAELCRAAEHRPEQEVMSHGDVDQKNLLITARGPVLCDWDVAAPVVPRRELADVALSMAGWERLDIASEVVRSYRAAGGEPDIIDPTDLGPSLMVSLDWIAFNVERAVGLRQATPEEAALGERLVPELLAQLPDQLALALRATAVLMA